MATEQITANFKELSRSSCAYGKYTLITIEFTFNDERYQLDIMCDIPRKMINVSKLILDVGKLFNIAVKRTVSNFFLSIDNNKYLDQISVENFGRLYYLPDGKCIYKLDEGEEFDIEQLESYQVDPKWIQKGKFNHLKEMSVGANLALVGEEIKGVPNEYRGKLASVLLADRFFAYAMPELCDIAEEFKEFMTEALNKEVEQLPKKTATVKPKTAVQRKKEMNEDDEMTQRVKSYLIEHIDELTDFIVKGLK